MKQVFTLNTVPTNFQTELLQTFQIDKGQYFLFLESLKAMKQAFALILF